MVVKLVILETIEIDGETLLGRTKADITIDDPKLSRRHAALRGVEGGLEVEDLGSSNGTIVAGKRIEAAVRLTNGERLKVGDTTCEVQLEAQDEPTSLDVSPPNLGATVIEPSEPPPRDGGICSRAPAPQRFSAGGSTTHRCANHVLMGSRARTYGSARKVTPSSRPAGIGIRTQRYPDRRHGRAHAFRPATVGFPYPQAGGRPGSSIA